MSPEELEQMKRQLLVRYRHAPSAPIAKPSGIPTRRHHRDDRAWYLRYHDRIMLGLETCRNCGTNENLTFGHDVAHVRGGSLNMENCTIMCLPCNKRQGTRRWSGLISLAAEEALLARCTGASGTRARPRMIRLRAGRGPRGGKRRDAEHD